jgi:hypothetical protein
LETQTFNVSNSRIYKFFRHNQQHNGCRRHTNNLKQSHKKLNWRNNNYDNNVLTHKDSRRHRRRRRNSNNHVNKDLSHDHPQHRCPNGRRRMNSQCQGQKRRDMLRCGECWNGRMEREDVDLHRHRQTFLLLAEEEQRETHYRHDN